MLFESIFYRVSVKLSLCRRGAVNTSLIVTSKEKQSGVISNGSNVFFLGMMQKSFQESCGAKDLEHACLKVGFFWPCGGKVPGGDFY